MNPQSRRRHRAKHVVPTIPLEQRLAAPAPPRSSDDRMSGLVDALGGIGSGLDLEQALTRIVSTAVDLADAKQGALRVLGADGRLAWFITVGLSDERIAAIGTYPAHSSIGVPIRVRDEALGDLYVAEKREGAAFDGEDEAVLLVLASAAGVVIDNTRLSDEACSRREWLEATAHLTRGLLSDEEEDADDLLTAFAQRARRFAAADLAVIAMPALPAPGSPELLVVAADGESAQRLRGVTLGTEGTLVGAVYRSALTEVLADAAADPRVGPTLFPGKGFGPALVTALAAAGQVRGVLVLARSAGSAGFDVETTRLTAELAAQAAVALELAERRSDSDLLALYADRDRIGRDLHDLAIQQLFATSMSLQGAHKIAEERAVAGRIAQAIADLDGTIRLLRSMIIV